jgi:hypothetical protein
MLVTIPIGLWIFSLVGECVRIHGRRAMGDLCLPLIRLIRPIGVAPPAAGMGDAVHRRVALPPPSPGSVAAHSATPARPSTAINVSASRCSSRRTSTGSLEDAVPRSRRRGPGNHVESSPITHSAYAFCHGERGAIIATRMSRILACRETRSMRHHGMIGSIIAR